MSRNTKGAAPQEEAVPTLVPKLRFPEFCEVEGWDSTRLGNLCETVTKGSTPTSYGFYYVDSGVRFVKIESLSDGLVDCTKTSHITHECNDAFARSQLKENDILFSIAGALGVIALVERDILPANINQAIGIIRLQQGYSHRFLLHQLQANLIQSEIHRIKAGAAQPNISLTQLGNFATLLPSPAEQQKIAECLSSVDMVIAAQARKADALKTHKKGLMQQLFPREDESQPHLRFPEFQTAGEWEGGELGPKANKVGSGITPTGGDKNYKQSGRPFVRSQNVGWGVLLLDDVAFIDEETHASFDSTEIKVRDVLLNITGASIGRSAVADDRIAGGNVNQHVCIIRTKPDELNPLFLNQFLISQLGQKQIDSFQAGGNRQGLNFAQIRSFAIPLPPTLPEQHRIAACLSSLDALITAETQKLAALKTHKRGLMQRLFPSPEGMEA